MTFHHNTYSLDPMRCDRDILREIPWQFLQHEVVWYSNDKKVPCHLISIGPASYSLLGNFLHHPNESTHQQLTGKKGRHRARTSSASSSPC